MTSWLGLLMSFARPTFVPVSVCESVCVCPQPMLNWKFSNWQINSPLKYTQRIPWHRNDNKAPNETRNSQWKEEGGVREREWETFLPQATSTPLALGVNVLGDADLSPVIYKRQCNGGGRLATSCRLADFWQLPHNCLATLAPDIYAERGGQPWWES